MSLIFLNHYFLMNYKSLLLRFMIKSLLFNTITKRMQMPHGLLGSTCQIKIGKY